MVRFKRLFTHLLCFWEGKIFFYFFLFILIYLFYFIFFFGEQEEKILGQILLRPSDTLAVPESTKKLEEESFPLILKTHAGRKISFFAPTKTQGESWATAIREAIKSTERSFPHSPSFDEFSEGEGIEEKEEIKKVDGFNGYLQKSTFSQTKVRLFFLFSFIILFVFCDFFFF